jgi:ectoine hydroxylase-related dioxygenase (phytanoyl-CoA dioxygenase family)
MNQEDVSTTYPMEYRIRNNRIHVDPPRRIEVHASPAQIQMLNEEGYLVRERLISGEMLEQLRNAADELEAQELEVAKPGQQRGFGGLFLRNLIDRHPLFLEQLLKFEPLLSVARAVLGPQVQIHASVLRVAYPELENQAVEWHYHQRVVPDPEPCFFFRPVVLDNLIYLDDLTEESGPLVVLPRTHRINENLPSGDFTDKTGQVIVTCPAGSVVTSHSSLWHRALAPTPNGGKRRLVIFGYSPTWMKPIDRLNVAGCGGGLTDTYKNSTDEEIRELLGLSGYY